MKKYRRTLATLALLMLLNGCAANAQTIETEPPATAATVPAERPPAEESGLPPTEETIPVRESVEETEEASVTESTVPKVTEPKKPEPKPERNDTPANQPAEETEPPATTPPETEPPTTEPPATEPEETLPPETVPEETEPPATEPPAEEPDQTEPPTTEAPEETTEPTEPEVMEVTYEFKRQVAAYAAQYLNQYRGSPCTVLSGMSQVAQYRASQLTWNFAHSTADKRAALAAFEYGEWIDATLAGLDESDSYYEAHTREAICRNFHGNSAEELGKAIADLIRNSGSHWCYVGDTAYSYMGVGVEYRDGWYACVMVGEVNYG